MEILLKRPGLPLKKQIFEYDVLSLVYLNQNKSVEIYNVSLENLDFFIECQENKDEFFKETLFIWVSEYEIGKINYNAIQRKFSKIN